MPSAALSIQGVVEPPGNFMLFNESFDELGHCFWNIGQEDSVAPKLFEDAAVCFSIREIDVLRGPGSDLPTVPRLSGRRSHRSAN